jgi:signal peptidase I
MHAMSALGKAGAALRLLGGISRELLLTAAALLGVLCIVSALASALFGISPLVVQSGSMSPAIETGALALARSTPAAELHIGDVVTVTNRSGSKVTHRVVAIDPHGDKVALTLEGDANASPDDETYVVGSAGKVFADIPLAGYVVATLGSPIVLVSGSCIVGWALIGGRGAGSRQRRTKEKLTALVLAVTVMVSVDAGAPTTFTSAYYSDSATLTTGSIEAVTPDAPTGVTCLAASPSATISWTDDPRFDYDVTLYRSGPISITQVTGSAHSITYTGKAAFGITTGSGNRLYLVYVYAYPAGVPDWTGTVVQYSSIRAVYTASTITVSCTT